jgi:hypothetical protein
MQLIFPIITLWEYAVFRFEIIFIVFKNEITLTVFRFEITFGK